MRFDENWRIKKYFLVSFVLCSDNYYENIDEYHSASSIGQREYEIDVGIIIMNFERIFYLSNALWKYTYIYVYTIECLH